MPETQDGIRAILTGQTLIEETLQPTDPDSANHLRSWIARGDLRFTNLEVNINKSNRWPMKYHSTNDRFEWPEGRTSVHAPGPEVLDELGRFDFNLYSLANNHAWDTGIEGILDTLDEFEQRALAHTGIGRNLREAEDPAYIETPNGTVGLVAMASGNLPPHAYALNGEGGRPGINPLKVRSLIEVPSQQFDELEKMPEGFQPKGIDRPPRFVDGVCGVSSTDEEGTKILDFLGKRFVRGEESRLIREIHENDRKRNLRLIEEASTKADLVMAYFHHHHWEPSPIEVGSWMVEFTHDCIDAGANVFIGAGVPMVKPIEIYKGMPIFYSLGNFIFHPNSFWPNPWVWQSVIVDGSFEDGHWDDIRVRPISLIHPDRMTSDDPTPSDNNCPMAAADDQARSILERVQDLSKPFGTDLEVKEDAGMIL